MDTENLPQKLCQRFEDLKAKRSVWEQHWREVTELALPRYTGTFLNTETSRTDGEKRTSKQYDPTAGLALERFGAVMESMLVPRNSRWHRLRASEPELNRDRDVKLYFERLTDIVFRMRYSPRANFASVLFEHFIALGAFGNGVTFIDSAPEAVELRYKAIHLGDFYFVLNHQGVVDTAFRRFNYTARQAYQRWGEAAGEEVARKAQDARASDDETEFLHVVMPREDQQAGRIDAKGMPFASYYLNVKEKALVAESGYNTFPYIVSRYMTAPGEDYGRGPAMAALPAIKTLNEEKKTLLKVGQRAVDPVLLAHDDGVMDTFSLKSGAVNYGSMSRDGRRLVDILPTGDPRIALDMMQAEQAAINDHFLVNLFQILVETPQMTATEVLERTREKGILLSPTMGRQQSELLGPLIERELDVLARLGALPPMPPALLEARGEYTVEYDSPLSRAQRAEEAAGFLRALEMAKAYALETGDLRPLDHFDLDTAIPAIAEIQAVPPSWMNGMRDIQALRESRAQQQAQQQAIEAAPAAAGLMKAAQ